MSKIAKLLSVIVILVLIAGFFWWYQYGQVQAMVFDKDQTFTETLTIPATTNGVVKNNATLNFEKDLIVDGKLSCDTGRIRLNVKGTLTINNTLQCNRPDILSEDDIGQGIIIVASNVNISKDAMIGSNGHVQVVTDASKLATDQGAIDKLYEDAGTYESGKLHIGPFTPLEQIPANAPGRPLTYDSRAGLSKGLINQALTVPFIPQANAAAPQPATDAEGNPVAGTVRIGGTWVIGGNPPGLPPARLDVPTPPKNIKKIILNFDFGKDNNVTIQNFELHGPNGNNGQDSNKESCNANGTNGSNALRFNVYAGNLTVSNFNLHLGSGGDGGMAETTDDCEDAKAKGGNGGEAGNFRMVAEETFNITGALNIYPGKGGKGGDATAHGKKGEDAACKPEKGGDATANGGAGGDNKKVLVATGTINGKDNITIGMMTGGNGGDATANGGHGGNASDKGCAGADGGKATATAGKGGDTTCAKFPCTGGDGGDANAKPGNGGNGGLGSPKDPGGNGGKGGNAVAKEGAFGIGKTANGREGVIQSQTGGNGGNGGDGCGPGTGGKGGSGKPDGQKGADGKNLCIEEPKKETSVTSPPSEPAQLIVPTTTPTPSTEPIPTETPTPTEPTSTPTETPFIRVNVNDIIFLHAIGTTDCPQNIGTINLKASAPANAKYIRIATKLPQWLSINVTEGGLVANVTFTCSLQNYDSQTLTKSIQGEIISDGGEVIGEFSFNVTGKIQATEEF